VSLHGPQHALQRVVSFCLYFIERLMESDKCVLIALVNQVLFRTHVVVEAGLCQSQFICDIG